MPHVTGLLADQFWQHNWRLVKEEDKSEFLSIYSQKEWLQYWEKLLMFEAILPSNLYLFKKAGKKAEIT